MGDSEHHNHNLTFSSMDLELKVGVICHITFLIIISIVGLFGNLLTIIAILRTNKLRITANYFLVNLAIADVVICTFVCPFYLLALFHRKWPLADRFCAAIGGISCIVLAASVLSLLAISINRYFCIVKNKLYAKYYSTQRTIWHCVIVWIASVISISPTLGGLGEFGFNEHILVCGYKITYESWKCQIATMIIIFIVSTSTILFCYYNIWKEVYNSSNRTKRKASTVSQISLSGSTSDIYNKKHSLTGTINDNNRKLSLSGTINDNNRKLGFSGTTNDNRKLSLAGTINDNNRKLGKLRSQLSMMKLVPRTRDIQVAKTSLIVLLTFMICWTPTVIQVVFDRNFKTPDGVVQAFAFLALANSSINPFIYAWRNRHFRKAYKRIITCRHCFGNAVDDISHGDSTHI
ncbi:melatonin receptor type 1B-like [Anneissia japonica]|uniref:melatonin receptor type 1B-like n=1 Tax=Anneissia japonica TaxID=1529436 RepID=UPI001425A251|nr:melatonin receptor type 1B-like [Anneissia japonica]